MCVCVYIGCRGEGDNPEQVLASLVISSQIPGYNGSKVDSKDTVEVTFPINVRMHGNLVEFSSQRTSTVRCMEKVTLPEN